VHLVARGVWALLYLVDEDDGATAFLVLALLLGQLERVAHQLYTQTNINSG